MILHIWANNHKELKKLLKEDKFPILVADYNAVSVVETLESLKQKGIIATAKDKLCEEIIKAAVFTVMPKPPTIDTAALISLYALYRKKNTKATFSPNGSVTIYCK